MRRFVVAALVALSAFTAQAKELDNPYAFPESLALNDWIESDTPVAMDLTDEQKASIYFLADNFLGKYLNSKLQYGICNRIKITKLEVKDPIYVLPEHDAIKRYGVKFTYRVSWSATAKEQQNVRTIYIPENSTCHPDYWKNTHPIGSIEDPDFTYLEMSTSMV